MNIIDYFIVSKRKKYIFIIEIFTIKFNILIVRNIRIKYT